MSITTTNQGHPDEDDPADDGRLLTVFGVNPAAPGAPDASDRASLGYDPVERFMVPRLPGLPGIGVLRHALRQAVDHRLGVLVTGPVGYGKSEGAHAACEEHAEEQFARVRQNPRYRRTRVVYVNLRTASTKRQLLVDLLTRASPGRQVQGSIRGQRKDDDQLRDDLYRLYTQQGVAALVVDDAQRLSKAGLELLRDLIAAREEDLQRTVVVDGVTGSIAVGVGVVLVGTPDLIPRVIASGETHGRGRWAFENSVSAITEAQVGRMYAAIFPAFDPHITAAGPDEWNNFIANHVCRGRQISVRLVTTHAREYFARTYDDSEGSVADRREAPFDRARFLRTLKAVEWQGGSTAFPTPQTSADIPKAVL